MEMIIFLLCAITGWVFAQPVIAALRAIEARKAIQPRRAIRRG